MAMKEYILNESSVLSEEQLTAVRKAEKKPVVFDEDSPELTDQQLAGFRRVHEMKQAERRRQNITLRLTPQTIQKAKSLGKGYSGILSRIIESTINDPEMLKRFL
ncbi:MAG: antitoxin [Erysipelotrichaceae bacterium]|nr:antitoxin [Erysipelotrichaceae bacterium]